MAQDPTLTIKLAPADFIDLYDGSYNLNFTRDVINTATNEPSVWEYTVLTGSKAVKEFTTITPADITDATPEVPLTVQLTSLSGAGYFKYKLSYVTTGDKLADDESPIDEKTQLNKKTVQVSLDKGDSLISKRAITIEESQSYQINDSQLRNVVKVLGKSWANKPWTVGFDNNVKVRPIILREEGTELTAVYVGPWWVKGKGRLTLPQEDRISIWFATEANDVEPGINVQDVSDPTALEMKRGSNFSIAYRAGVWGTLELVPQNPPAP